MLGIPAAGDFTGLVRFARVWCVVSMLTRCLLLLISAAAVYAQRIDILLMNPSVSRGCPAKVHFAGNIHPYAPVQVVYKFVRSDGAISPEQTINFTAPRVQPISFDWELSKDYSGWVQLVILSPKRLQTAKRAFQVRCR